jgi:hypothetical protein
MQFVRRDLKRKNISKKNSALIFFSSLVRLKIHRILTVLNILTYVCPVLFEWETIFGFNLQPANDPNVSPQLIKRTWGTLVNAWKDLIGKSLPGGQCPFPRGNELDKFVLHISRAASFNL